MTSPIAFPANIIGLMSGTSADGVDAALLTTDGREFVEAGESLFLPYSDTLRADILALMRGEGDETAVAAALTNVHIEAVRALQKIINTPAHAVGFHGQTIRHAPHEGVTVQIGDPARMARVLGIPVVADFRSNDVKNGGQGAPLVPIYHAALAATLPKPLMVVNIGGVANVTWVGESSVVSRQSSGNNADNWQLITDNSLLAFDCGPGNALIDDWVHRHTGARYDKNGGLAARGTVDEAALTAFLANEFFARAVPKSLDRNAFSLAFIEHLSPEDGAATLTAMTAAAIAKACEHAPQKPKQLLITGGGRHNPTLMRMIESYAQCDVTPVEAVGWNGDMLEAEAFAYLAARSMQGLPLSLPTTTGAKTPVTGGALYLPPAPHHHHDDDDDDNCTAPRTCCR